MADAGQNEIYVPSCRHPSFNNTGSPTTIWPTNAYKDMAAVRRRYWCVDNRIAYNRIYARVFKAPFVFTQ